MDCAGKAKRRRRFWATRDLRQQSRPRTKAVSTLRFVPAVQDRSLFAQHARANDIFTCLVGSKFDGMLDLWATPNAFGAQHVEG